jgi:SET domain-containing protein
MLLVRASVRPSPIHGLGCFAEEPIRAGQVVWVYDERVDTAVATADLHRLPEPVQEYFLNFGYEEIHDGVRVTVLCGDHAKYVNHSDDPNLIDGETNTAARDIAPGEELTCNYFKGDLDAERKLGRRAGQSRGKKIQRERASALR